MSNHLNSACSYPEVFSCFEPPGQYLDTEKCEYCHRWRACQRPQNFAEVPPKLGIIRVGNMNWLNFAIIWVFPKIRVPQNGWFIMENPIKKGWFGDTIIFGNTHFKEKSWKVISHTIRYHCHFWREIGKEILHKHLVKCLWVSGFRRKTVRDHYIYP